MKDLAMVLKANGTYWQTHLDQNYLKLSNVDTLNSVKEGWIENFINLLDLYQTTTVIPH